MICASLALLQTLLSLTHWIFGSLMLPYESCSLAAPSGGQNKTPRNILFISISTVSTGCCATVHILHRMCKLVKVSPRRTMVSFIGMFTLVHPFATTWHFPSRGNEKFRGAFLLIDQPNGGGGKGT